MCYSYSSSFVSRILILLNTLRMPSLDIWLSNESNVLSIWSSFDWSKGVVVSRDRLASFEDYIYLDSNIELLLFIWAVLNYGCPNLILCSLSIVLLLLNSSSLDCKFICCSWFYVIICFNYLFSFLYSSLCCFIYVNWRWLIVCKSKIIWCRACICCSNSFC